MGGILDDVPAASCSHETTRRLRAAWAFAADGTDVADERQRLGDVVAVGAGQRRQMRDPF
jgi:hypothetical protein